MIALTRAVSPRIDKCELTFLQREPIDPTRAAAEHEAYERCLETLGCTIVHIDPLPDQPDGVFVEDAAIVLDDIAVITRPGARSRQGETASVAHALERYRPLRRIEPPATLDGGDVLRIGQTLYVGLSRRTNATAIEQLTTLGYPIVPTDFHGCLHLKSAVTQIAPRTPLVNPDWIDVRQFEDFDIIEIDEDEPFAANALRIGETIVHAAAHVMTRRILEKHGYGVVTVAITEMQKAEAGVTCCSLILS